MGRDTFNLFDFRSRSAIRFIAIGTLLAIFLFPYAEKYYRIIYSRVLASPLQISLVQLMATPEKYHRSFVTVRGWCVIEFEDQRINLTSNRDEWFLGVWLDLNESQLTQVDVAKEGPCIVDGVFRGGVSGHLGLWHAELSPVSRIAVQSPTDR